MIPQKLMNSAIAMIVLAAISPARADGPTPRQACLQSNKSAPTWKANCEIALSNARTEISQYDQGLSMFHALGNNAYDPSPIEARIMVACLQATGSLAETVVNCEKGVSYARAYNARFEAARAANNAAMINGIMQNPDMQKMLKIEMDILNKAFQSQR